jgi:4-hydroxy-3-methylbut-2-enyl diphosphate reductase
VAETSDRGALVLAPMGLEWRAVRRALAAAGNPAPVVRCGISLSRWEPPPPPRPALITCGLAGGLRSDLLPGTVVVADSVAFEDGDRVGCDPQWVAALIAGARACGQEPVVGPMLTARRLVVGDARRAWAARGFVAAEMETALLASIGAPLASLRVIVDAPAAEVSERWTSPGRAALDPRRWREAAWLAARAPGYARLAARCVAGALIFAQRS